MAVPGQILPTRGAVIFGDNSQNLINTTLSALEKNRQNQILQEQKKAQQLANSWTKNMLSASSGRLWSDDIGKIEQSHIAEGEQLMSAGIDPYSSTDPRAVKYRSDRANVENMRAYREGVEKEYNALNNVIRKDISKWNPSDLNKLNEFISGSKFEDVYSQNQPLPQVRQNFNVQDSLKSFRAPMKEEVEVVDGIKSTKKYVDRNEAESGIISRLGQTPGGAEYLSKLTGGFTIPQLKNAPDNIEGITKLIDGSYDSNPALREQLATQGIVSKADPRYNQFIQQEAQNMFNAKTNYDTEMDGLISNVSGGTTVKDSRTPDYSAAREKRAQEASQQSKQRLAMSVVRFNERFLEKPSSRKSGDDSYNPRDKEELAYGSSNEMKKTTMNGFTKFGSNNVDFIGNGAIDLRTGEPMPNVPVRSGNVVALGSVPVNKATGRLMSAEDVKANPENVVMKKMALTESKSSVGNFKNQALVPAENLPDNMPKNTLYKNFMNSSVPTPTGGKTTGQAKGKASSTSLSFFKK